VHLQFLVTIENIWFTACKRAYETVLVLSSTLLNTYLLFCVGQSECDWHKGRAWTLKLNCFGQGSVHDRNHWKDIFSWKGCQKRHAV